MSLNGPNVKDEEDTKFTKLFVGGIPYHTPDETLREYFEQFDDIVEAVIIRERNSQRSKGYGFVTMATKEGAERACVNKRPIIDGRRANVDLAYLGAKPKPTKVPQRDDAASPESNGTPVSPTNSEAPTDSGADWAPEEFSLKFTNPQGCNVGYRYDTGHPSPPAPIMIHPSKVKPARVSSMQTYNSNVPMMNNMAYYAGSIPPYSSAANAGLVDPKYMDPSTVGLVTYVPQVPVTPAPQNAQSLNMQCLPQYNHVPQQPSTTKLIPNPRYVYTMPVWYVDQGRMCGGPVSLEPVSNYSQVPFNSSIDGSSAFSACKMYPIATYY